MGSGKQQTFTINPESSGSTTSVASIGRVGVEAGSGGTSLLHSSWGTTAAHPLPPATNNTREGRTIVRPSYAAGDPPLSPGELITSEPQSASTIRLGPTSESSSLISRSIETRDCYRERCHSSRTNYRNHRISFPHKGHDMDTTDGSGENLPNSGTPSPEVSRSFCLFLFSYSLTHAFNLVYRCLFRLFISLQTSHLSLISSRDIPTDFRFY